MQTPSRASHRAAMCWACDSPDGELSARQASGRRGVPGCAATAPAGRLGRPQMDAMGEGVGKLMGSGSYVLGCTRGYVQGHGVDFIVRNKNPPQLASDESRWTCIWNTFGTQLCTLSVPVVRLFLNAPTQSTALPSGSRHCLTDGRCLALELTNWTRGFLEGNVDPARRRLNIGGSQ